eukprot:TRINITY_DN33232_c0_g1_i1.p1 TRINITY_DN33232_c0_g1~~TRINITY_DN33232_c0_g1_i1.p1  ORF type:complete len:297 (+),score=49.99 TRINITY_DN33232_c0_g1_i1:49-891(+)
MFCPLVLASLGLPQVLAKPGDVLSLDQGLELRVLRDGDGRTFPSGNEHLSLHYRGTLSDGREFDSTQQYVDSPLGPGMWRGLMLGVHQMSLGQRALLHVPGTFGRGEGDVDVEVELLAIGQTEAPRRPKKKITSGTVIAIIVCAPVLIIACGIAAVSCYYRWQARAKRHASAVADSQRARSGDGEIMMRRPAFLPPVPKIRSGRIGQLPNRGDSQNGTSAANRRRRRAREESEEEEEEEDDHREDDEEPWEEEVEQEEEEEGARRMQLTPRTGSASQARE